MSASKKEKKRSKGKAKEMCNIIFASDESTAKLTHADIPLNSYIQTISNSKIKCLDINLCQFNDSPCANFTLPYLEEFSIVGSGSVYKHPYLEDWMNIILQQTPVTKLTFWVYPVEAPHFSLLRCDLSKIKNLTVHIGTLFLEDSLPQMKSLEELHIFATHDHPSDITAIISALEEGKLKRIVISSFDLDCSYRPDAREIAQSFMKALHQKKIPNLVVRRARGNFEDVKLLVKKCPLLESIKFEQIETEWLEDNDIEELKRNSSEFNLLGDDYNGLMINCLLNKECLDRLRQ
ncbi:hypothetical protein ROZALSC1DRAFT_31284 [Rozella allomycis CSF55]|nr:hypothetical protein ROZALSC1DRAFT_31284 [Rozella allomycis CSF55]